MSVKTDAELTAEAEVIRDETVAKANTKGRIATMFEDIIDNKPNKTVTDAMQAEIPVAATQSEVDAGTATGVYVNPATLQGKIDTDDTLAANSDTKIPSQKAVKTYIGANVGGRFSTEGFVSTITFDLFSKYSEITQSGPITITQSDNGNVNDSYYLMVITGDNSNNISFDTSKFNVFGTADPLKINIISFHYINSSVKTIASIVVQNKSSLLVNTKSLSIISTVNNTVIITDPSKILAPYSGSTDLPFSVSGWVYLRSLSASLPIITIGDGSGSGYMFYVSTGGVLSIQILSNTTPLSNYIQKMATPTISTGSWVHVGFSYSGSKSSAGLLVYVNGSQVAQSSSTVGSYVQMYNTGTTKIGYDTWRTLVGNLDIDELCWCNAVLTPQQFQEAYNGGVPIDLLTSTFVGSIQYYAHFENNLNDSTINNLAATCTTPTYDTLHP
jgi:hypothetical protein